MTLPPPRQCAGNCLTHQIVGDLGVTDEDAGHPTNPREITPERRHELRIGAQRLRR